MIDKYHRKIEKNEEMRAEIVPLKLRLNLDLGSESYSMRLENAEIIDFKEGLLDNADLTLTTSPEDLAALIDGSLRPMKAYVTKRIAVKGKLQDVMFLKKFF